MKEADTQLKEMSEDIKISSLSSGRGKNGEHILLSYDSSTNILLKYSGLTIYKHLHCIHYNQTVLMSVFSGEIYRLSQYSYIILYNPQNTRYVMLDQPRILRTTYL